MKQIKFACSAYKIKIVKVYQAIGASAHFTGLLVSVEEEILKNLPCFEVII